ncbi:MAG: phenylalanine--tRNA ligase subunit beta, partial [Lachnospiraceae bacterium]|nr:phenylalanine--tRNA ligase subunit beta [Lachnospiraceae bacterium]
VFGENEDFYTLKGLVETVAKVLGVRFTYEKAERSYLHPYRTAEVFCEGEKIGVLGQVRYEITSELDCRTGICVAELDMSKLSKYYGKPQVYTPLPKFDVEKRDFAFVVDASVTCASLQDAIAGACPYVTSVELFDVYKGLQVGPHRKSMAFSVVFTPKDKAFTDAEIGEYVNGILSRLKEQFGAELRS